MLSHATPTIVIVCSLHGSVRKVDAAKIETQMTRHLRYNGHGGTCPMIPLSDDNSQRQTFPAVNYLLIAINFGVFLWVYYLSGSTDRLVGDLSVLPFEIRHCPWSVLP